MYIPPRTLQGLYLCIVDCPPAPCAGIAIQLYIYIYMGEWVSGLATSPGLRIAACHLFGFEDCREMKLLHLVELL